MANYRKTNISCPLIRTLTGGKNVRFSENLPCFVFLLPPFLDPLFCLLTDYLSWRFKLAHPLFTKCNEYNRWKVFYGRRKVELFTHFQNLKERSFLLPRSNESTYLIQYNSNFYSDSILLSCVGDRLHISLLILSS